MILGRQVWNKTWINTSAKMKRSLAFTLAEVLIVLGIVGIVAEMTIPTLVSTFQDQTAVAALKTEANNLQQAITMACATEGNIDDWYSGIMTNDANAAINTILVKYLKVVNNCDYNNTITATCTSLIPTQYTYLNKSTSISYPSYSKMQLADGSTLFFTATVLSNVIGYVAFYIDVNGLKGPNQFGYDLFVFSVLGEKYAKSVNQQAKVLVPYQYAAGDLNQNCSTKLGGNIGKGILCAAWPYYQGNRDYLHCDDLNWQTKTTCN